MTDKLLSEYAYFRANIKQCPVIPVHDYGSCRNILDLPF